MGDFVGGLLGGDPETPDYSGAIAAAKFQPWNVTTGYGTSKFDEANKTASYALDPRLAKFRDIYYGAAERALPNQGQIDFANRVGTYGQDVFNRGMNLNVDQTAQDYLNKQLAILQPGRAQEESRLADTLFRTGRTGAGAGTYGGGGYVNPEQYSLLKAREEANAQLGLESYDRARNMQMQDINQGLGLFGTAQQLQTTPYATANTLFGLGSGMENLGMGAMTTGIGIGSAASQSNAAVGNLMAQQENARVAAENTPGFFESLLGTAANIGLSYAMPGIGKAIGGTVGGWLGGSSPSSGLFGNSGFGNQVSPWNATYSPQNLNIGMGGYNAPSNYGGGILGPSW